MQQLLRKSVMVFMALVLAFGVWGGVPVQSTQASALGLVISQVYGSGGNAGAIYTHDFIELLNASTSSISLNGLSVQYASATGTGNFGASATQLTELPDVTLAPGQYYLIQESGGPTGIALPTPDLVDATPINISGTNGKVVLVTGITSLGCNGGSAPCDATATARIIDLIGFGTANYFEGSAAAPALSATTAAIRALHGLTDTDDNAADFSAGTPEPRNTASPLAVDLAGFSAVWQGDAVAVTWETAQELDNLGFNLYRGESEAGPWVKLNEALIPTQVPGAVSGAVYEWLDASVTPGAAYFYRLEDVDIYGLSTFHGPVSTEPTGPSAVSVTAFGAHGAAWGLPLMLAAFGLLGAAKRRE